MPPSDQVRLRHIVDAARRAMTFLEDRRRDDLGGDEMLGLALVRFRGLRVDVWRRAVLRVGHAGGDLKFGISEDRPQLRRSVPADSSSTMGRAGNRRFQYLADKTCVGDAPCGRMSFDRFE